MIICCLGDSLTEGDYGIYGKSGIGNVQPENYPYFLQKLTGAEVKNFGKCGYRSSGLLKYYKDGNIDVKGADIIIIMLGTNGGQSVTEETEDNIAYRELVNLCKSDAPNAKIVICTPPHCTTDESKSNCGYIDNVTKATAFARRFASENGYKLIDVNAFDGFNSDNEDIMQPNDGLHFGKVGYKLLAEFIYRNLTN